MATSKVVYLVLASILINLAASIVTAGIVAPDGTKIFNAESQTTYSFDSSESSIVNFTTELEKTIKPAGSVEDAGDQIYRVMDTMSLGFLYNFFDNLDTFLFSSINIVDNIIGYKLTDDVRVLLFGNENTDDLIPNKVGVLKIILSLMYIFAGIQLFTGTDVMEK